jgi:FimV-like protein
MKKSILLNVALIILIEILSVTCLAQTVTNTYGPLKSSDRLWNIAASVRPDKKINHFQAMLALLKANPHAFRIPCNLNSLKKVGPILSIPSRAKMRTLSKNKAIKEFYRQDKEWKDYSKRGKPIVCSQEELPVAETEKQRPSMSQMTTQAVTAITVPIEPVIPTQQESSIEANTTDTIKTESIKTEPIPILSSTWDSRIQLWFSPTLLLSIGIVIVFILFLFAFFIGRLSGKRNKLLINNTPKHPIDSSTVEANPLDNIPVPPVNSSQVATNSLDNTSVSEKTPIIPIHQDSQKILSDKMQEKLDNVRAYLAEDEDQIIQKMLREVIQEGSIEQQSEARQLYEINKKINYFKQHTPKPQQIAISKPTVPAVSNPVWQDLKQMGEHCSTQQYLPENQDKTFELIDKIFELLDNELNAQGRLVEGYLNRSQQNKPPQRVDVRQNYEIVEKSEKLVVDDEKKGKPRAETEPTRHM